jgi:hypothetical protein
MIEFLSTLWCGFILVGTVLLIAGAFIASVVGTLLAFERGYKKTFWLLSIIWVFTIIYGFGWICKH